jgi:putative endonuclease
MEAAEKCYTYMVRCSDGTLYTGWTKDLEERLKTHNAGKGGKYTRSRLPVELVYREGFETKEEAMSREWHLKRLSRREKLRLIEAAGRNEEVQHG